MPHTGAMRRTEPSRADGRPPRAHGRWLTLVWLAGTVAAVCVTVAAVQLAGSEVTGRPIPSVSSEHLQAALIDDALTLSNEQGEDASHGPTATNGTESGEPRSGTPSADDHPGGDGSPVEPGDDHAPAPTTTVSVDDHGEGPLTPTTTAPAHPATTTTTAPPSVTYSKGFTGGTVSVRCTGNRITLLSASPSVGFTTSVSNVGPEEVEVHFTSSSKETEISARCTNGVVSWQG